MHAPPGLVQLLVLAGFHPAGPQLIAAVLFLGAYVLIELQSLYYVSVSSGWE